MKFSFLAIKNNLRLGIEVAETRLWKEIKATMSFHFQYENFKYLQCLWILKTKDSYVPILGF